MYDFQFIIAHGPELSSTLGSARAMFKQQFPDPGTIKVVNTSFTCTLVPGKLQNTVANLFHVVLTLQDDSEIVGVGETAAPPSLMHPVK